MKVQRYSTYALILGVLCVAVAGPVLTEAFSTWPVVLESSKSVPETSLTNIQDAYHYPYTILTDNQLSIKIASKEANSRIVLRIYEMITYQTLYDASLAPSSASQSFAMSIPTYGSSASSSSTSDSVFDSSSDGSFAIIEFGGSASGWYPASLQFIPGDYMVVVYGENMAITGVDANFTIQITQEIFGRVVGRVVNTTGWSLIIICSVICLALWVRKEVKATASEMEVRP